MSHLSIQAYLLLHLFCFSCLSLPIIAECFFFGEGGGIGHFLLQSSGPHSLPMFCCIPAPIQQSSHDPFWNRLITVPPSNFDLMCIRHSAKCALQYLQAGFPYKSAKESLKVTAQLWVHISWYTSTLSSLSLSLSLYCRRSVCHGFSP